MAFRHLQVWGVLRRRTLLLRGAAMLVALVIAQTVCVAQEPAATAPPATPPATPPPARPAVPGAAPVAPAAAAAPASRYKEQSEFKEPPGSKIAIIKILNEGQITDQKMFDDWCRFRIAEFTLGKNASLLPEMRKKLKQELQRSKDPARAQAVARILAHTREIIADAAYSPTARVNAVLILGELNKTEPDVRGTGAVPLPEAQVDMLKLIDSKAPVNDVSDALRAAALIGLERHAAGPMGEDLKKQLSEQLRGLIALEQPPAGRSDEVQDWLSGRAKRILEAMGAGATATSP